MMYSKKNIFLENTLKQAQALQGNSDATTGQTTNKLSLIPQKDEITFSLLKNVKTKGIEKNITFYEYINLIKDNPNKKYITEKIHPAKQKIIDAENEGKSKEEIKPLKDAYSKIKINEKAIVASAIYSDSLEEMTADINYEKVNNLLCIDFDNYYELNENVIQRLKNDPYTKILHKSIGGVGYCLFIELSSIEFESHLNRAFEYYFENYNLKADQSCSNISRKRIVSYDPDIYFNPKAKKFNLKKSNKKIEPKIVFKERFFVNDDIDEILNQITTYRIDIAPDYHKYMQLGFAIKSEYGASGFNIFDSICSVSPSYNEKAIQKDYEKFLNSSPKGKEITFGTFFYLCQQAGVNIVTSKKAKEVLKAVKSGYNTFDSVKENVSANGFNITEDDRKNVMRVIEKPEAYLKQVSEGEKEVTQLKNFIFENYNFEYDTIKQRVKLDNKYFNDNDFNSLWIKANEELEFNVKENHIYNIINSNETRQKDVLKEFIEEYNHSETGYIEQVLECIQSPMDKEYIKWVFTKYVVGAWQNWTLDQYSDIACPFILVLASSEHGLGKTTFLRGLVPKGLKEYMDNARIENSKVDHRLRICENLFLFDDEFSGSGHKNLEALKAFSDIPNIEDRLPYGRTKKQFIRKAILCATTNNERFLTDDQNRRILPIIVKGIDFDKFNNIDKNKLWIEAYNLYKAGFDWKIYTKEDKAYLKLHTMDNNSINVVDETFENMFSIVKTKEYNQFVVLTKGELLKVLKRKTGLNIHENKIDDLESKYKFKRGSHKIKISQGEFKSKNGFKLFYDPDITNSDEVNPEICVTYK